jgi:predicted ArsR family transcriptional regulator
MLALISIDGHGIGTRLAGEFGLSRQAANSHLQAMVHEGLIEAEETQCRWLACAGARRRTLIPL